MTKKPIRTKINTACKIRLAIFGKNDTTIKEWSNFVEKNKKIRELASEENVAKADEVINKVNNAETADELEKLIMEYGKN